jgi:tRNA pseudouridine13 synthase
VNVIEIPAEDVAVLEKLAGARFATEIVEMFREAQTAEPDKRVKPIASDEVDDKYTRGQIHQEVRRIFQSRIDTTTNDTGAIVATAIRDRRGKKRGRGGGGGGGGGGGAKRERKDNRPAGEYLHFTLFKDNRDTMDAVSQIARMLRTKPQMIGYAGTKDRRASTAQRCSVRYTHQRGMAGLNGKLWGISTGDYEYKGAPIHLGDLLGNEFTITLKNCKMVDEDTSKPLSERLEALRANVGVALEHMTEHGWINYFGQQRFGTHQIGTHEIGMLILGDKFEEAVISLLSYDEEIAERAENGEQAEDASKRDEFARNQACMLFCTRKDIDRAVNLMPRRFAAECCVVRHLTRQPSSKKDFVGALTHITRGLRSMYLHAYQSYVWNHAASTRWVKHGEKVVKGDLIIVENEAVPLVAGQDQDGDVIINPVEDDDEAPVRARPLTEEEATSGRYTIADIVLPTPGYEVIYPDNEIGQFYSDFMGREENGGLDPRKMQRMRREFSLPGRYRKVMNRFLANPSIEFRAYADEKEQMHPTDVDLIKAAAGENGEDARESKKAKVDEGEDSKAAAGENGEDARESKKAKVDEGEDSKAAASAKENGEAASAAEPTKIAAVVKFQLGRSAYATVTLRELMGDLQEE